MTKKESPAGDNRWGKSRIDEQHHGKNITVHPVSAQGLCSDCVYFRAVLLESGRVRRVCSLSGERISIAGVPMCSARQIEGGAR